jgi:hypothetical protein
MDSPGKEIFMEAVLEEPIEFHAKRVRHKLALRKVLRELISEVKAEAYEKSVAKRKTNGFKQYQARRFAFQKAHRKANRRKHGKHSSKKRKVVLNHDQCTFSSKNKQQWFPRTNPHKSKPNKKKPKKVPLNTSMEEHKESRTVQVGKRLVRCFAEKEDAITFCLLAFLFAYSHRVNMNSAEAKALFFIRDEQSSVRGKRSSIVLHGVREYRVFYNPCRSSGKFKEPFLVAVQYEEAGIAYYLCNGNGVKRSNVLLSMPSSTIVKRKSTASVEANDTFEMIDIVDHKTGTDRSCVFPKCSVNVILQGADGSTIEEPLDKVVVDAPYQCYLYGKRKNLFQTEKWKSVLKSLPYDKQEDAKNIASETLKNCTDQSQL